MSIPNFVKLCQLVQKFKGGRRTESMRGVLISLILPDGEM